MRNFLTTGVMPSLRQSYR